jgi:transposase
MPRQPLFRPWTAEDGALLAKLLREGKSHDQIARHIKRTASAVREHAKRLRESERRPGERELKTK